MNVFYPFGPPAEAESMGEYERRYALGLDEDEIDRTVWTTREGVSVLLVDMTDAHVRNSLAHVKRSREVAETSNITRPADLAPTDLEYFDRWIAAFTKEQRRRRRLRRTR